MNMMRVFWHIWYPVFSKAGDINQNSPFYLDFGNFNSNLGKMNLWTKTKKCHVITNETRFEIFSRPKATQRLRKNTLNTLASPEPLLSNAQEC